MVAESCGERRMLELKRVYWTRHLMRLAMAVLIVWIIAAAVLTIRQRTQVCCRITAVP